MIQNKYKNINTEVFYKMQENFAIKAKTAVRKIAAVGAGVAMLGATMSGALAASYTLGDYPKPFVMDGKYQNLAYVFGDTAASEDNVALTAISNKLAGSVTSGSGGGGGTVTKTTITGGVEEDIPLGVALTATNQIDADLDDGDIKSLLDTEINWRSSQYDISEHVVVNALSNGTAFHTSLTSGEDDYKDGVYFEIPRNGMYYYYAFDEAINLSDSANPVNSNYPLELNFLGRKVKITAISATQFTANVGAEYFLKVGESVVVEGKTVTLNNVASGTSPQSVILSVDGVQESVSGGSTETVNGIDIKVDETFYSDTTAERSATLIVGKQATKTYKNGDAYIGEPEQSPDWKWDIGALTSNSATSIVNNNSGIYVGGIKLGVRNNFLRDTKARGAVAAGECISYPENYISICYDKLNVADDDYMDLWMEYLSSADLSVAGIAGMPSSAQSVHIYTDQSEGLVVDADSDGTSRNWADNNVTTEKKTKDIYLYTDVLDARHNATMLFYYDNDVKDIVFAGNITDGSPDSGEASTGVISTKFAHVNFGDTKNNNAQLHLIPSNQTAAGAYNITLRLLETTDFAETENITTTWFLSGGKFKTLGASAGGSTAEGGDVIWRPIGAVDTFLGAKDENHRTKYGVIIENPDSQGSSDRVHLMIPSDIVQGIAKVGGTRTEVSGDETPSVTTTAPTPKKASQVTNIASWNVITVGGPCVNTVTASLLGVAAGSCGAASGIAQDTAVIQLKANGANWALVAAGWEAADTRRAGVVLANYDDANIKALLSGKTSVTVTGTSLDLSGITVA